MRFRCPIRSKRYSGPKWISACSCGLITMSGRSRQIFHQLAQENISQISSIIHPPESWHHTSARMRRYLVVLKIALFLGIVLTRAVGQNRNDKVCLPMFPKMRRFDSRSSHRTNPLSSRAQPYPGGQLAGLKPTQMYRQGRPMEVADLDDAVRVFRPLAEIHPKVSPISAPGCGDHRRDYQGCCAAQ
jgi:hypothetical protein